MTPLLFASLPLDSADTLASQAIHAAQQAGVAADVLSWSGFKGTDQQKYQ